MRTSGRLSVMVATPSATESSTVISPCSPSAWRFAPKKTQKLGQHAFGVLAERRRPADLAGCPSRGTCTGMRERLEFADAGVVEAADQLAARARAGSARISATSFTGPTGTSTSSSMASSSARSAAWKFSAVSVAMTSSRFSTRIGIVGVRRTPASNPSALHSGAQCWSLAVMCAYLPSLQRNVAEGTRPGCSVPSLRRYFVQSEIAAPPRASAAQPGRRAWRSRRSCPCRCARGRRARRGWRSRSTGRR